MLNKKRIVLGVTAGIAAYKTPHLVRLLVKAGAEVRVVMTPGASDFVTAKTLSVVSKSAVWIDFFDANHEWHNHVQLAEWADVMLVAPLTANTLAKMASGGCDNILLAVYYSMRAKTVVAPAMDLEMFLHPTVKSNLETIKSHGVASIPPASGELASGLHGQGRMAEPEEIVAAVTRILSENLPLNGVRAVVNAGPTYEPIDPVRFIGNHSTGKMGVAIAEELAARGASVTLVAGPGSKLPSRGDIQVQQVTTAREMLDVMLREAVGARVVVCSAAVADYRPEKTSDSKIKKNGEKFTLQLVQNPDILKTLGEKKTMDVLVGFALETSDLEKNAREKLRSKNLDLVVANAAGEPGSGIGADFNRITLIDRHNKMANFELMSKSDAARHIVDAVLRLLNEPV